MPAELDKISEDNYLIVKSRFKSAPASIYGLMIIMLNNDKEFTSFNAVVSTSADIYDSEISAEWHTFEEEIVDLKWKNKFNNNLTSSLTNQLDALAKNLESVGHLYDFAYNYDYNNLDTALYDLVNRIIHDKNLSIETVIQEVTTVEFNAIKEKRSQPRNDADKPDKSDSETGTNYLSVDMILSPVKGKPIYSLKIGDKLMVKIKPNSGSGNFVINELGLRDENGIKPVPGEIVDIKIGPDRKDPVEILTEILPGYYGKAYENEKGVKLRVFDPSIDKPIDKDGIKSPDFIKPLDDSGQKKTSIFSTGTLLMLIVLVIILGLFVLLILFT